MRQTVNSSYAFMGQSGGQVFHDRRLGHPVLMAYADVADMARAYQVIGGVPAQIQCLGDLRDGEDKG